MLGATEVEELRDVLQGMQDSLPLGSPCPDESCGSEDDLDQQYLQVPELQVNEVVFVREQVAVWPTRSRCISGRLSLVMQHCELFMAWLPYAKGQIQHDGSFKTEANQSPGSIDAMRYAVLPLPVSEVRWLRPATPRGLLGGRGHRLEVGLVNGITLPPLHFPPGTPSLHVFMELVRKHVGLVPSPGCKQTWMINAVPAPLARSLDALELADVMLGAPARAAGSGGLAAHATWAPPPPPVDAEPMPLSVSSSVPAWPSWTSWVTNAETVWDSFVGQPMHGNHASSSSSNDSSDTGNEHSKDSNAHGRGGSSTADSVPKHSAAYGLLAPALTGAPSLSVLGHAAWRALSRGVAHMASHYSLSEDFFADDWQNATAECSSHRLDSADGNQTAAGRTHLAAPREQLQQLRDKLQADAECCNGQPWAEATHTAVASNAAATGTDQHTATVKRAPTENSTHTGPSSKGAADEDKSSMSGSMQDIQHKLAAGADAGAVPAGSPDAGSEEDYEMVEVSGQLAREARRHAPAAPPVDELELYALMGPEGNMSAGGVTLLRERVWQGGVVPEARRVVWPLLLGLRDPQHTQQQADAAMTSRREQYQQLCQAWQTIARDAHTSQHHAWWQSCSRVDKDVGRTDRTHPAFASPDSAATRALRRLLLCYITLPGGREYCQVQVSLDVVSGKHALLRLLLQQGLSDLAAPLLVVLGDEVEAFWALTALLSRLGRNFEATQESMHAQLAALQHLLQLVDPQLHAHLQSCDCQPYFFAFRWLLITFKRDFPYDAALRIWEAVWCAPTSPHMHLYLAAAILVHYRQAIMNQVHEFDAMLRFAVQLSGHMEAGPLLRLADALANAVGGAADERLSTLTPTRMPPATPLPWQEGQLAAASLLKQH